MEFQQEQVAEAHPLCPECPGLPSRSFVFTPLRVERVVTGNPWAIHGPLFPIAIPWAQLAMPISSGFSGVRSMQVPTEVFQNPTIPRSPRFSGSCRSLSQPLLVNIHMDGQLQDFLFRMR